MAIKMLTISKIIKIIGKKRIKIEFKKEIEEKLKEMGIL
ncbi:hypothetical protein LCGC14_1624830 [marine sediment metagenome]|uniref:Uncharacterized protein n=1 Tax=marine sediment metagenome TaxID=412755 RepID=A0A0F9I4E5_9ZZZZ